MVQRLLLFAALFTLLAGCRKDPSVPPVIVGEDAGEGWVRLNFVPEWEGQPFQAFTELQNISGYRVQVEKVQFHMSDLRLHGMAGSADAAEILFFDLIDGPMDTLLKVPAGSWSGLEFGLGVKDALNQTSPTLYPNGHPLSGSHGMHWPMLEGFGYIFTKFEGRHDTIPGSSGPFPEAFTIHTGNDTCYVQVGPLPMTTATIANGDTIEVNVKVAIDRFFYSAAGDTIDLATEYMSHGTNIPLSMKLARNTAAAFSID